ncbi:MAG: hypothetical protein AAFV38_08470 [Pseudomonadota bacterium]
MVEQTVEEMAAKLAKLMHERLGIRRGENFADKVRIAGRLLPRHVRRDAQILVESLPLLGHPKLARQVDDRQIKLAYRGVERHLLQIDRAYVVKGRILSVLAVIAFNILLIAGLIIGYMVWNGDL